jgi:hypothetical protein
MNRDRIESSDALRAYGDRVLQTARRGVAASDAPSQVMFYNADTIAFAHAWGTANPNGYIFELAKPSIDPSTKFIYYICMRLQQLGTPVSLLLISGKAAPALFYAGPDTVVEDSLDVVGPLPANTTAADFGSTLVFLCASGMTVILLGDSIAAEGTYGGTVYAGVDFISTISATASGYCLASDQPVTRNADGTAVTVGNIWQSDSNGDHVNKYPAAGGGQTQPFPLTAAST